MNNLTSIIPIKLVGSVIIVDAIWSLLAKSLPHEKYMDLGRLVRLLCGIYIMLI